MKARRELNYSLIFSYHFDAVLSCFQVAKIQTKENMIHVMSMENAWNWIKVVAIPTLPLLCNCTIAFNGKISKTEKSPTVKCTTAFSQMCELTPTHQKTLLFQV